MMNNFQRLIVVAAVIGCQITVAGDTTCRKDLWGTMVCTSPGSGGITTIRENVWDEQEVRRDGKLIARCKTNIWGDLVCEEE